MYEALKQQLPEQVVRWSESAALIRRASEADASPLPPEQLYALPAQGADLSPFPGRCRLVARSEAQLRALNGLPRADGRPIPAGLLLVPEGFGPAEGFSASSLPAVRQTLRALPGVSAAGCFVTGLPDGVRGAALGRFFHAAYQAAKAMSAVLPCAMPYLGFCGVLAALEENRLRSPETLEQALLPLRTVAMQNETAFYARLLLF